MFDIHCSACERRVLIFPGQITGLVNDEAGILVHFTCWCGAPGAWRTGAAHSGGSLGDRGPRLSSARAGRPDRAGAAA